MIICLNLIPNSITINFININKYKYAKLALIQSKKIKNLFSDAAWFEYG